MPARESIYRDPGTPPSDEESCEEVDADDILPKRGSVKPPSNLPAVRRAVFARDSVPNRKRRSGKNVKG